MPAAEFDALTPTELGDLIAIADEQTRAADYRAGILATICANANIGKDSRPFHPADFFPSLERMRPAPTDDDVWSKLDAIVPGA